LANTGSKYLIEAKQNEKYRAVTKAKVWELNDLSRFEKTLSHLHTSKHGE